jgi:hypothetical protein
VVRKLSAKELLLFAFSRGLGGARWRVKDCLCDWVFVEDCRTDDEDGLLVEEEGEGDCDCELSAIVGYGMIDGADPTLGR